MPHMHIPFVLVFAEGESMARHTATPSFHAWQLLIQLTEYAFVSQQERECGNILMKV